MIISHRSKIPTLSFHGLSQAPMTHSQRDFALQGTQPWKLRAGLATNLNNKHQGRHPTACKSFAVLRISFHTPLLASR